MMNETIISVDDLSSSLKHFGWLDYVVFVIMLVTCAAIGFYFGFMDKKSKIESNGQFGGGRRESGEASNYLVGGRRMQIFPIALSLVASWVSGIALLGTSTEIYIYGIHYAYMLISCALSGIVAWYVYIPVFHELQLTSTYEYFEMRFSRAVRLFGAVLFLFNMLSWLPIVIYVPALAFNQVADVNIHVVTPIICIVCIFYTCVGGIKAVVWTDVLQTAIMMSAIVTVIIKGTTKVGGFDVVWQRNLESGRLELPEITMDPTIRYSVFSIFGGGFIYWIQTITTNQLMMQRYAALPTVSAARTALIIFLIGLSLLLLCCIYNGMLIYATYYDCDPLTTKLAKAKDQLVPLIVMDLLGNVPGFPGFFISGVLSAALSSMSTGLNSLTAIILEDFWKPFLKRPMSERQTAIFMRVIVVLFGSACVGLVFVVEKMGAVLQLTMALTAVALGPTCGLFIIGPFLPWVNSKSALTGGIVSLITLSWICVRSQLALASGEFQWPEKPVRIDGCTYNFTFPTVPAATATLAEHDGDGYRPISHFFHVAFGCVVTIFVATISSFAYGSLDPRDLDPRLLAPFIRKFIKSRKYLSVQPDVKERESVIHAFEIRETNLRDYQAVSRKESK